MLSPYWAASCCDRGSATIVAVRETASAYSALGCFRIRSEGPSSPARAKEKKMPQTASAATVQPNELFIEVFSIMPNQLAIKWLNGWGELELREGVVHRGCSLRGSRTVKAIRR